MIPLSLSLHNFLSYRETTVTFEGMHVVCLSGANGHGKTALLDAITWALWGQARARADDLVHGDEPTMDVELDFRVGLARYRVARKRSRRRGRSAGRTMLDLYRLGDDGLASMSGNTMRQTQAVINRLLRLDYDTFVHSAYLLQGSADAFTLKAPGERKEVLGRILGLTIYDELADRARSLWRERRDEAAVLDREVEQIDQELANKEGYEQALTKAQSSLAIYVGDHQGFEAEAEALREYKARLDRLAAQLPGVQSGIADALRNLSQLNERKGSVGIRVAAIEEALANRGAIEDGFARLGEARSRNAVLDPLQIRFLDLEAEKKELGGQVIVACADLEGQGRTMQQKVDLLRQEELADEAALVSLEAEGAVCPLCGAELGKDRRQHLQAEYEAGHQRRVQEIDGLEVSLETVARRLAEGDYTHDQRAEIAHVKAQIEEVGYDRQEHQATREAIKTLAPFEARYRQLQVAEANLAQERAGLTQIEKEVAGWQGALADNMGKNRNLQADLEPLDGVNARLTVVAVALRDKASWIERLHSQVGAEEARLEHCSALEDRRRGVQAARNKAGTDAGAYEALTEAFGKRGIQALLIEAALPEIEDEANRLLARMTDGRMSLHLETQRETQTGKTLETLDIKIGDELGVRAYELYSGGEAFRINFALRVALSRFLAHRASATLPTLVIDEGFGSQDGAGRNRLIEAINAIKDDFELVLVVTHIEAMKDAFPSRIEVNKTDTGSVARVYMG